MAFLRKESRSKNISFQIDNVNQRAKQSLFSLCEYPCALGHCPGPAELDSFPSQAHTAWWGWQSGGRGAAPLFQEESPLCFSFLLRVFTSSDQTEKGKQMKVTIVRMRKPSPFVRGAGPPPPSDLPKYSAPMLTGLKQDLQSHLGFIDSVSLRGNAFQTPIPSCAPLF